MEKSDSSKLILFGAIGVGIYILLNKAGNLFGSTPAPNINTGLNGVFTEQMTNHRKYTYSINTYDAQNLAETIYSAMSVVSDDFDTIMGAFKNCTTQGDVFQVVQLFNTLYSKDLWTFLQTGVGLTPLDGLSNAHLTQINDYVNSLTL